MVNKRFSLILLYILIFSFAYGQSKFKQKLNWEADENALEYEVTVVSVDDENNVHSYKTEKNEIKFSIPAGRYKYQITAYDFLGRKAQVSEWKFFDITKALEPKIRVNEKNPAVKAISEEEIMVSGVISNITEESVAVLINSETKEELPCQLEFSSKGNADGTAVASGFIVKGTSGGFWNLKVTNPSGLNSTSGEINLNPYYDEIARRKAEELRLAEEERLAREKAEAERLAREAEERERAEQERLALEKQKEEERLEQERLAREKEEAERLAREEEEERIRNEKRLARDALRKKRRDFMNAHFKFDVTPMVGMSMLNPTFVEGLFEYSDSKFVPAFNAKLYCMPVLIKTVRLGLNMEGSFTEFTSSDVFYSLDFPLIRLESNLIWQKELLKNHIFWNIKGGANAIFIKYDVSYHNNTTIRTSPSEDYFAYIGGQGGTSIWFQTTNKLVLELGTELVYEPMNRMHTMFMESYFCVGFRL